MLSQLPQSINLLLESLKGGPAPSQTNSNQAINGAFPLGDPRRNFQITAGHSQGQTQAQSQQNQALQTVFIGDLPKDVSMVELYEYIKSVAGECDLVLKRPQMKYFYYAFARFSDILDARKLLDEVKFPQVHGKTCRALPYDKDLLRSVQAEGNVFVKGFGDKWTHKDLHEAFKAYGEVVSSRVSIEEGHKSRGFGYVQYRKPEAAQKAVDEMNGKKYEDLGFELCASLFKTPHERGSSIAGNSTSTTALFSKKFNNLFVKNFPKAKFSDEELKALFEPFGEIVSAKVFHTDPSESNSDDAQDAEECEEAATGLASSSLPKSKTQSPGYGFVCFATCEDARKALEHFHEKGDESSVSIDLHSSSKGDDSTVTNQQQLLPSSLPKLYVVPALKKSLRDAYVRMRTLKFKKQMARQNLYFRGFPVDPSVSSEETQKELTDFFKTFGEVSNLRLMIAKKASASEAHDDALLGFGFVCFKSVEDAQRARVEASKRPFRGCSLYISQFETREQRKAHMLERIDQIEFQRYKKREEVKKDMDKLEKLGNDLRSEQGQLLLTLLKLLAQLSKQRQKQQLEQRAAHQLHQQQSAPPAPRSNSSGSGVQNRNQRYQRRPMNQQNQQQAQNRPPQMHSQAHSMPMPDQSSNQQSQQPPQDFQQQQQQQPPTTDIRQYYQQALASMVNSPQFVSVDEPAKRNLVGSFIYPYINLILKQSSSANQSEDHLNALTAKVTGMIIEIPALQQMFSACQTLDALHLKSQEAVQLIQQAEAAQSQLVSSSSSSM